MTKFFTLSLLCMFLLTSCKNNGGSTDPTLFHKGFQGITETKDSPTPVGWVDNDDWKSDGYWNLKYPIVQCGTAGTGLATFMPASTDTSVEPIPVTTVNELLPAYPNPGGPSVAIEFGLAQKSVVYLAIIDDAYRVVAVLMCNSTRLAGVYRVIWNGMGSNGTYAPDDVYRAVFLVTNTDGGFVFASHGDVWINH